MFTVNITFEIKRTPLNAAELPGFSFGKTDVIKDFWQNGRQVLRKISFLPKIDGFCQKKDKKVSIFTKKLFK